MGEIKRILLTGASGFLGSHLLQLLINKGYNPLIFLRPNSDKWRIQHLEEGYTSFVSADNGAISIANLFKQYKIEGILHVATEYGRGISLSSIIETNVLFPLRLIEEGIKNGLKLFINTDTFFGKKQFDLRYLNGYTTSKRILEGLLQGFSSALSIANLRIEHVYGENDSELKFVTNVLKQAIQNKSEILLTQGLQKRDFVYVEDVANAYISIIEHHDLIKGYNEFEVGMGQSISVKEFVTNIAQVTETKASLKFGAIPVHDGEIKESCADISALKNLGWEPQYNIDTALLKIIQTEKKRFSYGS